jgi:hypothetical protein
MSGLPGGNLLPDVSFKRHRHAWIHLPGIQFAVQVVASRRVHGRVNTEIMQKPSRSDKKSIGSPDTGGMRTEQLARADIFRRNFEG